METIFTKDKLAQSKAAYTIEANMLRPVSLQVDGDLGPLLVKAQGLSLKVTSE